MAISGCFGSSAWRICLLSCNSLSLQQHAAHVVPHGVFLHAHLGRGLFDEHGALTRRVEIERVDVKPFALRSQQVDLQQIVAEILPEPADTIAAVALRNHDLFALHFGGNIGEIGGGRLRIGG